MGGARQQGVEVRHQAATTHRVEHGPGGPVQSQDHQTLDGIPHELRPLAVQTGNRRDLPSTGSGPGFAQPACARVSS